LILSLPFQGRALLATRTVVACSSGLHFDEVLEKLLAFTALFLRSGPAQLFHLLLSKRSLQQGAAALHGGQGYRHPASIQIARNTLPDAASLAIACREGPLPNDFAQEQNVAHGIEAKHASSSTALFVVAVVALWT
jgi:hypothetical protein